MPSTFYWTVKKTTRACALNIIYVLQYIYGSVNTNAAHTRIVDCSRKLTTEIYDAVTMRSNVLKHNGIYHAFCADVASPMPL